MTQTVALIVAAGRGERARRAGDSTLPKQYSELAGQPVLRWTAGAFLRHAAVSAVQVVIRDEDRASYRSAVAGLTLPPPVCGGATRQESVHRGLESLIPLRPDRVLIHDGARPLVSQTLIARVAQALDEADAVAPLLGVADTLRRKTPQGYAIQPRDDLFRAQTPQGFRFAAILDAHRRFAGEPVTDDFALAERGGLSLASVPGEEMNLKLTTPEDFVLAERLAASRLADVRIGTGFDAHGFGSGDSVWLCGVNVPHDFGLEGHSDADCGLHALTDAILGAIASADIGAHFPPSEERWRGAGSHLFLAHAASLVRAQGGIISHVDVTLLCERPKIGPHRDAMRARMAEILGMDIARVSVKATTTDGLGFIGRREGIAAQAVATIRLPV
ncbi:MAG TPA: bifunctional 2-C-methyl-D-erythritol 4-phosphate cytidylyltransferase/2-C-methyl-D-erythritol 2,4-cyclodiphosphate synthase [Micropepsaceae bacterium]